MMRFSKALTRPAIAARNARNARGLVVASETRRAQEAPVCGSSLSEA
jgi:hypothetical protein